MATPKRVLTEKASSQSANDKPANDRMRTTLMISEEVDVAIEVCAAKERKQKSEVVNEVLREGMLKRGYL